MGGDEIGAKWERGSCSLTSVFLYSFIVAFLVMSYQLVVQPPEVRLRQRPRSSPGSASYTCCFMLSADACRTWSSFAGCRPSLSSCSSHSRSSLLAACTTRRSGMRMREY